MLKIAARPSDMIVALLSANFWILWNAITISFQNLSIYPDWALITDIGLFFYGLGFFLSTWGILTLRLSFSVLPEKRKIIHNGPYRYIPHPIYLGYALMTLGQSLSTGFITLWSGTLLYSLLFIWRASKENKILYS
ncbi:MAG: methyltransferase [Desulfosporosinus sp.]|nr:methyltransferase [Desulfosporosinus sp.]